MKRRIGIALLAILLLSAILLAAVACRGEEATPVTVAFDVDGEVVATVEADGSLIEMPADPVKEGYHFEGWYFDKDKWEVPLTEASLSEFPTSSSVTVYAKWRALHKHAYSEWQTISEPTCTTEGRKRKVCDCGATVGSTISPLGHDLEHHEAKAATCTEAGWAAYDSCTRCDHTTYKEIRATGHAPTDWIVTADPTCVENGSKHKICTRCDAELEQEEMAALGHEYEIAVTEPTCTEPGGTTHRCSRCGDTYLTDIAEALGHDLAHHDAKAATCTEIGWEAYDTCTRCSHSTYAEIPALGHDYIDAVTLPTCTAEGFTTRTCDRCGYSCVEDRKEALGHDYAVVVTPATCIAPGFATHTCTRCGDSFVTDPTEALGHDYAVVVTPPTCTEHGFETHTCTRCGDSFMEGEVGALGHDLEHHDGKAATCTEIGWDAYDTCTRCDYSTYEEIAAMGHAPSDWSTTADPTCTEKGVMRKICTRCEIELDVREIEALGHDYEAVVIPATCTSDGYTIHTCSRCSDFYLTDPTESLGHDYAVVVTAPTCTDEGFATHTCTRCGDTFVDDEAGALGHDLAHHDAKAATCTESGWDAYDTCSRCSYTTYEAIPALGHDYAVSVIAPTCTEEGYARHACTRCEESYDDDRKDALGHEYDSAVTDPICTEPGYTTYTCSRCGDTYQDDFKNQLGHLITHYEAKAPTCTQKGWVEYDVCSRCDFTNYEELAPLGHISSGWITTKHPTCAEAGSRKKICTTCEEDLETQEIPALGHEYDATLVPPTCIEQGFTRHVCSRCESAYVDGFTDAIGHNLEHHDAQDPTCTEVGWQAYDACKRCSYTTYEEIDALGHSPSDWVTTVAATCAEAGAKHRLCTVCGAEVETSVIAALGHDYNTVVTDPTCIAQGYTTYTCTRCEYSFVSDYTKALGHDYGVVVTAPTCNEPGYTTYTCTRCGDYYVDDHTAPLGHDLVHHDGKAPTETEVGWDAYDTCTRCDYTTYSEIPALGTE